NTSTVETTTIKRQSDLQYQTLYSIVCNTAKFVNSLSGYEKIIYEYRYREKDIALHEWEEITALLDEKVFEDNETFRKSTTLRLRKKMLERYADKIGYTLM